MRKRQRGETERARARARDGKSEGAGVGGVGVVARYRKGERRKGKKMGRQLNSGPHRWPVFKKYEFRVRS